MTVKECKCRYGDNNLIQKIALTAAIIALLSAGPVFSQGIVAVKANDLPVAPPDFAQFDAAMTQAVLDIFNSPIMQAAQKMMAGDMGDYVLESMKISLFTTDRSIEDVTAYFSGKLGQEAFIEPSDLIDPPEEMMEMEEMTGLSWPQDYMDHYRAAYERHVDEESRTASFGMGSFEDKLVTIEIESPFLDPGSYKKVNETSIMYTLMVFRKK